MIRALTLLAALAAFLLPGSDARAQSNCTYIAPGAVLTAAQWNACFSAKQNSLGYTPVNKAGDVMLGKLVTAGSTPSTAGFNLPQGSAPTTATNGDLWTTLSGLYVRINGVTTGPLIGADASAFAATAPVSVTFPSNIITYALDKDANFSTVANQLALATGGIVYSSSATGGAQGAGTINVSGGFYINGVAVTAAGITALTGDVTATGPGSVAATLATVNSNVGSFGSSTAIPSFTVNGKGLITAASTNVVIAPAGTLTGTTLAANVVTSSITTVGALAAGSATTGFTINAANVTWSGQIPGVSVAAAANASGAPSATFGVVKCDGTTITCTSGVITAVGATATAIQVGVTNVTSGTTTRVLNDNAGILGEYAISGTGSVCMTTSCSMTTPALGTPSGVVLTSGTGLPISTGVSGLGTGVATALAVNTGSAGAVAVVIATGTKALATSAISSATCSSAQTDTATGAATTDVVDATFAADPTATTGYSAATSGMLTIIAYVTSNTVNFKVCNNTGSSITPGAVSLNWRVRR